MKNNNAGFSMMELLAAIVVLGILMGMAVPAVMGVMRDQRNKTYVEDSIRLASTMEYKMNSDNMMPVPSIGGCLVVNLAYLDNNTFNDAPNEGEYDRLGSFVVAKRQNSVDNPYYYYVRLIEKMDGGNYRGVDLIPVDNDGSGTYLYMNKAYNKCINNLGSSNRINLTDYLSNTDALKIYINNYGIGCSSVVLYAPDDTEE